MTSVYKLLISSFPDCIEGIQDSNPSKWKIKISANVNYFDCSRASTSLKESFQFITFYEFCFKISLSLLHRQCSVASPMLRLILAVSTLALVSTLNLLSRSRLLLREPWLLQGTQLVLKFVFHHYHQSFVISYLQFIYILV